MQICGLPALLRSAIQGLAFAALLGMAAAPDAGAVDVSQTVPYFDQVITIVEAENFTAVPSSDAGGAGWCER